MVAWRELDSQVAGSNCLRLGSIGIVVAHEGSNLLGPVPWDSQIAVPSTAGRAMLVHQTEARTPVRSRSGMRCAPHVHWRSREGYRLRGLGRRAYWVVVRPMLSREETPKDAHLWHLSQTQCEEALRLGVRSRHPLAVVVSLTSCASGSGLALRHCLDHPSVGHLARSETWLKGESRLHSETSHLRGLH